MAEPITDLLYLLSDTEEPAVPPPAPRVPPPKPPAPFPAKPARKPADEKWRKSPKVTLQDCVNGTGSMQRMAPGEIAGKTGGKSAPPKRNPSLMGFGKYATRLIADIAEEDPSYLRWAIENDVQGMREKCEKLGITEDDLG